MVRFTIRFLGILTLMSVVLAACQKDENVAQTTPPVTDSIKASAASSSGNFLASKGTLTVKLKDSTYSFDAGRDSIAFVNISIDGEQYYGLTAINKAHSVSFGTLDVCNGHHDKLRGYHYHVTPGRFPYVIGGYAGIPEVSNSRPLAHSAEGAIVDNSSGQSRLENVIKTIKPGTASRGKSHTLQVELAPSNARAGGLPPERPDWVQIGPYEATRIERKGNLVTIEITIPADATLGVLLDCHLEFDKIGGRNGALVFKRNDAFRVVE